MFAAMEIVNAFERLAAESSTCTLMLTGGRSAERVYQYWGRHLDAFPGQLHFRIFFGDERCVEPDHVDSNFGMAERSWLGAARQAGRIASVARMEAEKADSEGSANAYQSMLPRAIDFLLLSVGEDGHIASLFPHSVALNERQKKVIAISSPYSEEPIKRLTVTPPVFDTAKTVFILATGSEKGRVLVRSFDDLDDVTTLPVRLVLLRAILLLDAAAAQELAGIAKPRSG